jgi:hypothetical protein
VVTQRVLGNNVSRYPYYWHDEEESHVIMAGRLGEAVAADAGDINRAENSPIWYTKK